MDLFGQNNEVIRTIGFYQPFCSLMLHGKVETRWVRKGKFAPFPLGIYLGYSTKRGCSSETLEDWCGEEILNLIDYTLCNDNTQHLHGMGLWVGKLIKIGKMYEWQEKECFVKYKGEQVRCDRNGVAHFYHQQVLYFENIQPIQPFDFKYGKQGVGIFPASEKHFLKPILQQ
jgi:hypothetical protein